MVLPIYYTVALEQVFLFKNIRNFWRKFMSNESVFNKRHGEDDASNKIGGLLDQFNLPPGFIEFVRKNHQTIKIVIGVTIVLVVAFSLYGSYRDSKIENGATALSKAINESAESREAALTKVIGDFGSAFHDEISLFGCC